MSAPVEVQRLVERFQASLDSHQDGPARQARLWRDFLRPLFSALGWNMDPSDRGAEAVQELVQEPASHVGGTTKPPDYSLRIAGRRCFFLQVKSPSLHLPGDPAPAYQLRRYAWSAHLPLSILSDFAEFAVYDGRVKPTPGDKAHQARLLSFTFRDYLDRWDELAGLFSKEAVLKGSLDRFAPPAKGRRGTARVDAAFLAQLEGWRETLAQHIALRNPGIGSQDLPIAVQATLDRILFLRICEDRGTEPPNRLQGLTNGADVYPRLVQVFRQADARYHAGLFPFRAGKGRLGSPDRLTSDLHIDDNVLKPLIRGLYYPESPYEFSVLPADLLGQVYERFLGSVIRLTPAGHAQVEQKPEVKKAGGVFYTPTYIVEYIVQQTVGQKCQGKAPKDIATLRILDPACGSGSFLLGAYQYLLDWYLADYLRSGPEQHAKAATIYRSATGWRLTTAERTRILTRHLYGVDIDAQAVEVTKRSLLLKLLEGETRESLQAQPKRFSARAMPNLDGNITCGNSLRSFDWHAAFPVPFQAGGFDVVIGNPPYIRIQTLKEWAPLEVAHHKDRYATARKGNYDLFVVFVERSLQLLSPQGRLGFILPHKFFNADYGEPLRRLLAAGRHLSHVVHFGHQQVFEGATTYTCLMFLDAAPGTHVRFDSVSDLDAWRQGREPPSLHVPLPSVSAAPWNFSARAGGALRGRLMAFPTPLRDHAKIFQGLVTGADKVFVLEPLPHPTARHVAVRAADGSTWTLEPDLLKPFLRHVSLGRYARPHAAHGLMFPYEIKAGRARLLLAEEIAAKYPQTWAYLLAHAPTLKKREGATWNHAQWYAFGRSQNLAAFDAPKLIVQVISQTGRHAFDDAARYFTGGGNGPYYGVRWRDPASPLALAYLQGLLNSRLLDWLLHGISTPFRGGYWSYGKRFLEQLPIRLLDLTDPADRAHHQRMVTLVDQQRALHNDLALAKTAPQQAFLARQIAATDQQIDALVYALYGLTDQEIALVEADLPSLPTPSPASAPH